ncbi:MAG: hypothetical protein JWM33_3015 [Caulobacteraceae bacterium]|nr:hypothetical protein [Caulobacteraceae bacterium]
MGKYEPLTGFLGRQRASEVPVTFVEIERLIGAPLPPVARKHRAYWSNNSSNNVMTKAWLAAGFKAERVDMASGKLIFRRQKAAEPSISTSSSPPSLPSSPEVPYGRSLGLLDRIQQELGGTVTIPEGVDITQPAFEGWDDGRPTASETRLGRHPLFGALKGTVTVAPGVDLTAPSDELWDAGA